MEQINTSIILKYYNNNITVSKNIFYIKLLGYFEDNDFIQYINFKKESKLKWYFLILIVLFISKCSDNFINKFINEYYLLFPLDERIQVLNSLDYYLMRAYSSSVIKLIKKLSFYEQKQFIKKWLKKECSPTDLIINKLVSLNDIIEYINKNESLVCAINLYKSKYIDKKIVVQLINKTFESNISFNTNHKEWIQLIDISSDINFKLNLIVLNLLNCHSLYPFKKMIGKMPVNTINLIVSNKKLCYRFINSLLEFYDDDRMISIIKIIGKKLNPTIEQKEVIIDSLIKIYNNTSYDEKFSCFIKFFKLTPEDVKVIFKNISSNICTDGIIRSYFVYLKEFVIDPNEYFNSELRVDLFKKLIKFKLLDQTEIKNFILDNAEHFKYYYIRKYIKNFKQDYYEALVTNKYTPNSLWILHFKFKISNLEMVEKIFETLKTDEQDWVSYDLIKSLIKKFSLEKIQNVFLKILEQLTTKKHSLSWLFIDILRLCLIENKIDKITQEKKEVINKLVNIYKKTYSEIFELKYLYLN